MRTHHTATNDTRVPFAGVWTPGHALPHRNPGQPPRTISVPTYVRAPAVAEDVYAIQVSGNLAAMLVADGDILVLRSTHTWQDGQLALCSLGDDTAVLLAQLWRADDGIRLVAARDGTVVQRVAADALTVQAVVRGIMRPMGAAID